MVELSARKKRKGNESKNGWPFQQKLIIPDVFTLIVCPRVIYMLEGVMRLEQRQLVYRDPIAAIWIIIIKWLF